MAPTKKPKFPAKSAIATFDTNSSGGCFVALKLRPDALKVFGLSDVQVDQHLQRSRNQKAAKQLGIGIVVPPQEQDPPEMHTRGAWDKNLANPNRASESPAPGTLSPTVANDRGSPAGLVNGGRVSKPKSGRKNESTSVKRQPASRERRVLFSQTVDVLESTDSSRESSVEAEPAHDTDKENEMASKPKLNLKLSIGCAPISDPSQTPGPQSAQRTPSIKFTYKGGALDGVAKPKRDSPDPIAPEPSSKKRKTTSIAEKPMIHPPPAPLRKLTFTNIKKPEQQTQTPITPGGLKLKTKGKVPRRPLGVGYDSELDEREADPVILEGFILRMLPGPDCDYIRDAIEKGTLGVSRLQGGANVNMRFLDTQGRRGMINVNGHHYATSLVDLPCIVEGMKSWDKKGFIKSIDICQMLLVLGPCKTDEEAKLYPLPYDVNPHNYQYAHGITAPMKWVRKRRFARFKRARVDDVEAVDRKVQAMLEADGKADEVDYQVTDRDPRLDEPQYSGTEEEDSDDDEEDEGEGEEDANGEPDDYFAEQNADDTFDETPGYGATPQDEIGDEEVNDFERMLAEEEENAAANGVASHDLSHLAPETAGDSSFAVTSTSASPSAAAADTPASGMSANQTSDDDDDADEDEEKDEDEADDDENTQQVKERIQDLEERIKEQTETLKRTQNTILRRKIAGKIAELKGDVSTMKRSIGLGEAEGDDEEE